MKKLLLSMIAMAGFYSASAQLNDGCKAENFTFTALNNGGQVCDLYAWLDSGYVVILDVSATWCGPCWNYKQTGALQSIYQQHGPSGTNKVRVIFVEGDGTTPDAAMSGGTGSQGNWLSGQTYPMCNPTAAQVNPFNANYEIGYFPTIYMICPDRTVKEIGQANASQINTQLGNPNIPQNTQCAAKINVDATPTAIDGKLISCTGAYSFNLTLKNRGFNNLTSATINAKSGATTVATQNWTGNLTTYQSANTVMSIPNAVGYDSLLIEVVAAGDQINTNNSFTVYIDNYTSANASTLPYNENMDGGSMMPAKLGFEDVPAMGMFGFLDGTAGNPSMTGANGSTTKAVFVNFYNRPQGTVNTLVLGNYNTNTASPYLYLDFNLAYAQYQAENDRLEILTSTDCGATWTQRWTKSGNDMKTANPTQSQFVPAAANVWAYHTVDVTNIKNNPNALIAVRATSDYGNYAWIDNLKLAGSSVASGIDNVNEALLNIYPNPATDAINVRGIYGNANISLIDVMGRTVVAHQFENINNEISVDVRNLIAGKYFIKITQAGNTVTKPVVIAK